MHRKIVITSRNEVSEYLWANKCLCREVGGELMVISLTTSWVSLVHAAVGLVTLGKCGCE